MFTTDEFCQFVSGGNNEVDLENIHNLKTALDPSKATKLLATRFGGVSTVMTSTVTIPAATTVTAATAAGTTTTHSSSAPAIATGAVQGSTAPGGAAGVLVSNSLLQQVPTQFYLHDLNFVFKL